MPQLPPRDKSLKERLAEASSHHTNNQFKALWATIVPKLLAAAERGAKQCSFLHSEIPQGPMRDMLKAKIKEEGLTLQIEPGDMREEGGIYIGGW